MTGTDKQKNTEPARRKMRKPRGKWKDSHMVRFVLPVVLTILFPGGGIYYLCGRFSPVVLSFGNICMLYPIVVVFMFWRFFRGIVRLFDRRGKRTGNERVLIIAEAGVPLIFVGLFLTPFFLRERAGLPGIGLVGVGLRHRVESQVDIAATRTWLKSLDDEDYKDGYRGIIHSNLPESLRGLKGAAAVLSADENGNARIRLEWGGTPSGHWGVVIGMEDMEIPPSEFSPEVKHIVPVEPGVYVWWGEL